MEVLRPRVGRSPLLDNQTNANNLEQALVALGLGVRRRSWAVAAPLAPMGNNQCSPLIRLVTPAPKSSAGRRKFRLRAHDTANRGDTDRFVLLCQ